MRRFRVTALLVLALMALGITSCSETPNGPEAPSIAAPDPIMAPDSTNSAADLLGLPLDRLPIVGQLLSCRQLPYAETEKVIGPSGGTIAVGPHRLWIPPDALDRQVRIRVEMPRDEVSSVRLFPEGLEFRRRAYLTLDYGHCSLLRGLLPKRIAYTTEKLRILSFLLSFDNILAREVTAPLDHFSRYAVSW